jgi:hypothetical protein
MTGHAQRVDATINAPPEGGDYGSESPRFIPIPNWNKHYEWPPPGGMRHLRFHCETNGFKSAFKKVGNHVIVDAREFWRIVEKQGVG